MKLCAGSIALLVFSFWSQASDFEVVTRASRVDLEDHLESGQFVLFDFYADWCGPCRSLEPHLEKLAKELEGDLVIKKVDIVRWNTPVTKQYGISSIPHMKLFDRDGNLVSQGGARKVLRDLDKSMSGTVLAAMDNTNLSGSGAMKLAPTIAVVCLVLFALGIMSFVLIGKREQSASANMEQALIQRRDRYQQDPKLEPIWVVQSFNGSMDPMSVEDIRALLLRGLIRRDWQVKRQNDALSMTVSELMQTI